MMANTELRSAAHWHAPLRVSTNKSLLNLYDNVKVRNDAENARTLELQLEDKSWVSRHNMREVTRLLADNHGFAAPEIAAAIVSLGSVREVYDAAEQRFKREFPSFAFEGDERFYAGGVIAAYGVGCIGQSLGLFNFNIENCVDAALEQIERLRARRLAKQQDGFDSLGQFLTENNSFILTVREDRTTPGGKPVVQMPVPNDVYVRVVVVCDKASPVMPGSRLMINVARLRDWTRKNNEDFNGLLDRLETDGAMVDRRARVTLNKGTTTLNPAQAFSLILDLTHHRFAAVIASTKAIVNTNPALALLQGGKP
jgi:hypothetical protein